MLLVACLLFRKRLEQRIGTGRRVLNSNLFVLFKLLGGQDLASLAIGRQLALAHGTTKIRLEPAHTQLRQAARIRLSRGVNARGATLWVAGQISLARGHIPSELFPRSALQMSNHGNLLGVDLASKLSHDMLAARLARKSMLATSNLLLQLKVDAVHRVELQSNLANLSVETVHARSLVATQLHLFAQTSNLGPKTQVAVMAQMAVHLAQTLLQITAVAVMVAVAQTMVQQRAAMTVQRLKMATLAPQAAVLKALGHATLQRVLAAQEALCLEVINAGQVSVMYAASTLGLNHNDLRGNGRALDEHNVVAVRHAAHVLGAAALVFARTQLGLEQHQMRSLAATLAAQATAHALAVVHLLTHLATAVRRLAQTEAGLEQRARAARLGAELVLIRVQMLLERLEARGNGGFALVRLAVRHATTQVVDATVQVTAQRSKHTSEAALHTVAARVRLARGQL